MIERFEGKEGKRRLVTAIRSQLVVRDREDLATELAERSTLVELHPGTPGSEFIRQDDSDNDIYLVLSGSVSVRVNGREVAVRSSGNHVGEMALIDPSARRSASVIAIEETVLAKLTESAFSQVANSYPHMWRQLAVELGSRLRQRGHLIRPPNAQSQVFIGSSRESLEVAKLIRSGLASAPLMVRLWTEGVFRASRTTIESLTAAVMDSDFAVLVLTPDDTVTSRRLEQPAPRDNCIFELGLFMGALGRNRTYIVKPRDSDIKIPTDLLGLTPLTYALGEANTLVDRIAPVCTELIGEFEALGPR